MLWPVGLPTRNERTRTGSTNVWISRDSVAPTELLGRGCRSGSYGKVDKLSLDCCLTILLCLGVIVSFQRDGERCVHGEGGIWYAVTFRCPGAEVGHLTSLRTEGAPGVAFPGARLVAEGTDHARHCTMVNIRNQPAVNSGGFGA